MLFIEQKDWTCFLFEPITRQCGRRWPARRAADVQCTRCARCIRRRCREQRTAAISNCSSKLAWLFFSKIYVANEWLPHNSYFRWLNPAFHFFKIYFMGFLLWTKLFNKEIWDSPWLKDATGPSLNLPSLVKPYVTESNVVLSRSTSPRQISKIVPKSPNLT